MSPRSMRTAPIVIVPGWMGSAPGHWQVWLAEQLARADREVHRLAMPDVEQPRLGPWLQTLRAAIARLPEDGYDYVGHCVGAALWFHHIAQETGLPKPARVALVSPPSPKTDTPEFADFVPAPLDVDTVRHSAGGTVLVGGSDDPYDAEGVAVSYGTPLKIATTVIDGGGHLNPESGYGEWPAMLSWCQRDNLAFY